MRHSQQYLDYIVSPEWEKKRQQVLERSEGICERCLLFQGKSNLQVHHLHYDDLCEENILDLRALCRDCHAEADSDREQNNSWHHFRIRVESWTEKVDKKSWSPTSVTIPRRTLKFLTWLKKKGKL